MISIRFDTTYRLQYFVRFSKSLMGVHRVWYQLIVTLSSSILFRLGSQFQCIYAM